MRHSGHRNRFRLRTRLGIIFSVLVLAVWLVSVRWYGGYQGEDYWTCIDRGQVGILVNPIFEADLQPNSPPGWYLEALTPQARKWSWNRVKDDWNRVALNQLPDGRVAHVRRTWGHDFSGEEAVSRSRQPSEGRTICQVGGSVDPRSPASLNALTLFQGRKS